jgi:hypothetical protein
MMNPKFPVIFSGLAASPHTKRKTEELGLPKKQTYLEGANL